MSRAWAVTRAGVGLLCVGALVVGAACAAQSRLLRREYGPLGLEIEIWRLRDGSCERRAFVAGYFYQAAVPCPSK